MNGEPIKNEGVLNKIIIAPYADGEISIYTNSGEIEEKGIIKYGMAFVSLRAVAEAFDMKVTWNSQESTANIDDEWKMWISSEALSNMVGYNVKIEDNGYAVSIIKE